MKRSGTFGGQKIEKGMSVEVVFTHKPMGFTKGKADIKSAYQRKYNVDVSKLTNSTYMEEEKIKLMDKSKDSEFKKITELKWLPFIGKKYFDSDKKIMIIGESHYRKDNQTSIEWNNKPTFTRDIHSMIALGKKDDQTKVFYYLNRALFRNDSKIDTKVLWAKLAFYNFVQSSMHTRKSRPNENDYLKGWSNYFKLLPILKPDFCLFIGVQASDYLEKAIKKSEFKINEFKKSEKINGTFPREVTIENPKGKEIKLLFIKHTSNFFSWDEWNVFMKNRYESELNWIKSGVIKPRNTVGNNV